MKFLRLLARIRRFKRRKLERIKLSLTIAYLSIIVVPLTYVRAAWYWNHIPEDGNHHSLQIDMGAGMYFPPWLRDRYFRNLYRRRELAEIKEHLQYEAERAGARSMRATIP